MFLPFLLQQLQSAQAAREQVMERQALAEMVGLPLGLTGLIPSLAEGQTEDQILTMVLEMAEPLLAEI